MKRQRRDWELSGRRPKGVREASDERPGGVREGVREASEERPGSVRELSERRPNCVPKAFVAKPGPRILKKVAIPRRAV